MAMARSKLSKQEQQQIVNAYRDSVATVAELAEQFRVSLATITRVLKENIPPDEYQQLIQLRRLAARRKDRDKEEMPQPQQVLSPEDASNQAGEGVELPPEALPVHLVAELQEDLAADEDDDEAEEEEDTSDDLPEDAEAEPDPLAGPVHQIQVLPLEELELPETCYVVVDRYQELATRPLKEFLGPGSLEGIENTNTLPVFDNHKVARRFCEMSRRGSNTHPPYRVIHFPGYILEVVRSQLQKKGITHLLVDGQIYSL